MDYTVIGDMVNLASRLEGLTKKYHEPIIISSSVKRKMDASVHCRLLDTVAVKGRREGSGIFTVRKALSAEEEKAWPVYEQALAVYYGRKFSEAAVLFHQVKEALPHDYCAGLFIQRCAEYEKTPPPSDWKGVVEMTEK
jgi:hypothetical protein